jgi:hypothetical protein
MQLTTLITPRTFIPSFKPVSLILLSQKHCILSKPLSVPALSSVHNPVVLKILSSPSLSKPRPILDYTHANWPLFRSTLSQLIVAKPRITDRPELEHTIQLLLCSASSCIYSHSPTHRPVRSTCSSPWAGQPNETQKLLTMALSNIRVLSVSSPSPTSVPCSHFPTDSTTKF